MKVIWHTKAIEGRDRIADYICQRFGTKRRTSYLQEVREATKILKSTPNIGQIDPLFADRPMAYRSIIINGLSKLVYRIDGETVHIVAFWDTRQEPESQAAQI